MADTGHGAALGFATTSFAAAYTKIGGFSQERPFLDADDLSVSDGYIPRLVGDLASLGEFDCEILYDPNTSPPPVTAAVEEITRTYPTPAGDTSGATAIADGAISKFEDPEMMSNQVMRATITVGWVETITWSDSVTPP